MSIVRLAVYLMTVLMAHASTSVTLRPGVASSGVTNGDAFVTTGPTNDLSGNNYGGAGALAAAASGSAQGTFASVLRFDVSPAKTAFDAAYSAGGWSVEKVVLEFTTTAANNPIFNVSVPGQVGVQWIAADSWIEGTGNPKSPSATGVNWNDFALLLAVAESVGTLTVANVGDGVRAEYPLTLSNGLRNDISAGGSVGFALTAADSSVAVLFNSRSFGTVSRNPALTLTASPVLPEILALQHSDLPNQFILTFTSNAGLTVTIQTTTDLLAWVDTGSVLTTGGINTVIVSAEASDRERFWRLKRTFP